MASNQIQGKRVYLRLSPDSGTSWYVLVCLIKQSFQGETPVTETETQCETLIGLGTSKNKIPFEGACNSAPDALVAGIGQASHQKLLEWYTGQTALTVQQFIPDSVTPTDADEIFYKQSACYLTKYTDDAPVNDVIKFTGELSLYGTLDIAP